MVRQTRSRVRGSRLLPDCSCEALERRLALSTVYWDGGGDGVSLTDRYNWSGNHAPDGGDHAVINVAADPSLRLDGGTFAVRTLTLAEELTVSAGKLCIGEQAFIDARLNLEGGVIAGSGDLTISGKLKWTGGQIMAGGDLATTVDGVIVLAGSDALRLGRDLVNAGNVVWQSGDLLLETIDPCLGGEDDDDCDDDGEGCCGGEDDDGCGDDDDGGGYGGCGPEGVLIHNLEGATFKVIAGAKLKGDEHDRFLNEGTLVRDGEGVALFLIRYDSAAATNVVSGTLLVHRGGENSGARHVAAGAVLHYYGDYTHRSGSTLAGGGTTIWQGGTHTIAEDWTMASFLHVTNATITGPGTLSLDGPLTWNHGLMDGEGDLVINPTGKITLMTPGQHRLSRDIVNDGTLIWNNGQFAFEGATLTNNEGRFFYLLAGGTMTADAQANTIVNQGEIRKQLSSSAGFGGVMLDNAGRVNVRNGTLALDPARVVQIQGGTLTGGDWSVFGLGSLSIPGAGVTTIGAGASITRIGLFAGMSLITGITRNEGSIMIPGGGLFEIDAPEFTNAGTITIRKGTTLRVTGDYVQTAEGTLEVIAFSAQPLYTGRLLSFNHAVLAGTLEATFTGYAPQAGDHYLFLGAASVSGQFDTLVVNVTPPSSGGPAGALVYSPSAVELRFE